MLIGKVGFFYLIFEIKVLENQIIDLCLQCQNKEGCLRGRKEQFAKLSYWKRYRGFESRLFRRQKPLLSTIRSGFLFSIPLCI